MVAKPNMRASSGFNSKPKPMSTSGTPQAESQRIKSVTGAWGGVLDELSAHRNQGIDVEPIRRAKISDRLARDHHRSERTSGKARGIIKGRVG